MESIITELSLTQLLNVSNNDQLVCNEISHEHFIWPSILNLIGRKKKSFDHIFSRKKQKIRYSKQKKGFLSRKKDIFARTTLVRMKKYIHTIFP